MSFITDDLETVFYGDVYHVATLSDGVEVTGYLRNTPHEYGGIGDQMKVFEGPEALLSGVLRGHTLSIDDADYTVDRVETVNHVTYLRLV